MHQRTRSDLRIAKRACGLQELKENRTEPSPLERGEVVAIRNQGISKSAEGQGKIGWGHRLSCLFKSRLEQCSLVQCSISALDWRIID